MAKFGVGEIVLGKYEITRVLGQGGMGVVVAARHRELGELVALKFLQPSIRDNEASCARFVREARTATRIKNEHVARVFDVDTDDGTPFIVMEHLTGQDLSAEIRQRGPLPVARAVDLLLQACEAIADAHNLGIVHRDLKPANLFLTTGSDGMPFVKVLDFGISKSLTAGEESVTASHAVVGSPLYMSPEQLAASRNVDPRSDVWSLGIILYEMLTTVTPFPGDSLATVAASVFRGLYTRLSVQRPDVPAALDLVITDALTRDLEKRLPSVQAFAAGIAPHGSEAARGLLERIERIAARNPPAGPDAPDPTMADGPPSAAREARLPATTTGAATAQSISDLPRRPSRRRPAIFIAAGAAFVAAVAVVVGLRTRGSSGSARPGGSAQPAGGEAQVCPLEDADKGNLCHECRNAKCCSQYLACHESHACGDYMACVRACTGPTCKNTCIQKYGEGHTIAAPYLACVGTQCLGPCAEKNGSLACSTCQLANCSAQGNECLSDPACDALYACETACGGGNDACSQKCRTASSSATQKLFNDFFFCATLYCANACK